MQSLHNEPLWYFPFEVMERGESFFIPTLKTAEMTYAVQEGAKRAKVKVKVFVTMKNDHLGIRVWRVD